MDDKTLNEQLSRMAQAVARLERKTDFILDHLNLTYVDTPGSNIPPELREVYTLLQQGKKLEAIKAYRNITKAGFEAARAAVDKIEMGQV
jgi:ribosomal protein L7/L12